MASTLHQVAASSIVRTIGVCAALLFVGARPSAGQASPGVDAGSRVDLVLERGRFLEPLPFDVQFYLYGEAPTDLVYARGRYAHLTRQLRLCTQVLPPKPKVQTLVTTVTPPPEDTTQPPRRRDEPKPPIIVPIDVARPFTDESKEEGKSVFELSVDALDPNKEYCFEFELFYKVDDAAVRALGIEGIDLALRSAAGKEDTFDRPALYDRARERIATAIEAVRAQKSADKGIVLEIMPVAGAFFDLRIPAKDLPAGFRRDFDVALEAQATALEQVRSFGGAVADATREAATLYGNALFTRMIRQVTARSTTPAVALRLTGLKGALAAVDRPASERAAEPFGLSAAELKVAPPLAETWDPAAIGVRMRSLEERIREFAALHDLATDLSVQNGLRAAAGLDETSPAGNPNALKSAELLEVARLAGDAGERFEIARGFLELMQTSLTDRATAIARMTDQLRAEASQIVPFRGTTMASWKTRASQYISVDVGVASAPAIDSTFFYVGTNFYTGAVNKRAHLAWRDQSFRKRFAALFAIPLNPFAEDQTVDQFGGAPRTIEGVLGDRPLLVGAGWRLTDVVRITGGTVLFKVQGANPLVDTEAEPHFTWFMSMSVDWDIKHFFSGLTGQTPAEPD